MASLDDIVAATKILGEDSENLMGGSGLEAEENRVSVCDEKKDGDDGSVSAATPVVGEGVVENEAVLESNSQSNCGLNGMGNEKIGVGNLSSVGDGGDGVSGGGGVDGSLDGCVGMDEKIKDGKVSCIDNVGSESKELKENGRNNVNGNVDGDGKGRWNGEKLEDGDHGFRVGDFVWGKIKSHPWWPGQVFDPRDASEFAVKHSQEGRILVAFFGDGSCSWCLPSQLVPFVENFKQMSKDSSSKSFLNAIQRAIDEIDRLVEFKMTCKCIPLEKRGHIARPVVANAGVRAGILVPEVDISRLSIPEDEPAEVLAKVMDFAKSVSVDSMFELAILRSWVSAFYNAKCGYQLPVYREPLHIEGLEDNDEKETAVTNDFSVPVEVPIHGPQEDDWAFSPAKSQGASDDKIYHRRKQKSVAELMEKNNDKPKSQKRAKETSGRKRSNEVSESAEALDGVALVRKPKALEIAVPENSSLEAKEELEKFSSPRERKKSKYLSPPYTNLSWRFGYSGSMYESGSDKNMTNASGDLSESATISELDEKMSDEKPHSRLKGLDASVKTTPQTVENDKKLSFSVSDVNVPVNELLSEILLAAVDPFYLRKKGSVDIVWDFVSAVRSSTYLRGHDYKVFQKCGRVGRKRKSLRSQNQGEENAESPKLESPKAMKTERKLDMSKSRKSAEFSRARSSAEKSEGNDSSNLILTFSPGFPLPSKEEIVRLFSKFGSLNENETNVVTDSHSVQIVFKKDSDAEAAFKSSVSESPFGVENVNYWLQHSPTGSKPQGSRPKSSSPQKRAAEEPGSSQPADELISDARVIRQKLDIMTAILENHHSKFSTEDRSTLKDEMKHLMANVETASEKVRFMAENTSS